jgi:tetraacyldisaccharide 4'-kinase
VADPVVVEPRRGRGASLPGAASKLLVPLSWVYGAGVGAVRAMRTLERAPSPESVTVISVGNLEMGGNGKTPMALYLLDVIRDRGLRAVFLSRGYGSRSEKYHGVTLLAEEGMPVDIPPGARQLKRSAAGLWAEIGDEPALVARRHPHVPVVVSGNKGKALECAITVFAPNYVVVDDAFQSWRLPRDVDVVLLDALHPLGDGRLLPAGSLREEPEALERADVVLFNGAGDTVAVEQASELVFRQTGLRFACAGVSRSIRLDASVSHPVASLCAIARPEGFEKMLKSAGVEIRLAIRYPDHHAYSLQDVEEIRRLAREYGCAGVVTTEKDSIKLSAHGMYEPELCAARLEIGITEPSVLEKILKPQASPAASV